MSGAPFDPQAPDLPIAVVGAGAMGRGIAQVAAQGGMRVLLFDDKAKQAAGAKEFIAGMFGRAVEKGKMAAADAEAATERIEVVPSLAALTEARVVVEAVVEDLAVKRQVFAHLEEIIGSDTVLATNTSSLSVATIAAACKRPDRVAGFHFFNPVPLMALVEVIDGPRTAPWVADVLVAVGNRMGRQPVRVKDAPGFLVNQIGRGLTIESAHAAGDGVASFADIDRILRDAAGFRMGPFELMDLIGLDVTQPATRLIFEQSFLEPRFRPAVLMQQRLEAGLLGRKSEAGFYIYKDGKAEVPAEAAPPPYCGRPVWIDRRDKDARPKLAAIVKAAGARLDNGKTPGKNSLIVIAPLGADATTTALECKLDPARTVAVDALFGLDKRRTVMKTAVTDAAFAASAHGLFASGGVPATLIQDSPGFVAQRVVAMIVNLGCAVAQAGVASPADIDKAVKLGLGYPRGPLDFGDAVGPKRALAILEAIQRSTGDPRYRPTLWLSRRARLGVSLLTPDA